MQIVLLTSSRYNAVNKIKVFKKFIFILIPMFIFCSSSFAQETRYLNYDGFNRKYLIQIPSDIQNKQVPLLIALHGGGGTVEKWAEFTNNGFEKLSEQEKFILVYPQGLKKQWNDTRDFKSSYAHRNNIDDVGFLSALIDHLENDYQIDKKRVYVVGVSNGAMMAQYLALKHADKITAIASIIGSMPKGLTKKFQPVGQISVLMLNGEKDPLVPWNGGAVKLGKRNNGEIDSVDDTLRFWVDNNNCVNPPVIENLKDLDTNDETTVEMKKYLGCANNTQVVLYKINGGGHTWPAYKDKRSLLKQLVVDKIVGKKSRDIDTSVVVWNFFKNLSK